MNQLIRNHLSFLPLDYPIPTELTTLIIHFIIIPNFFCQLPVIKLAINEVVLLSHTVSAFFQSNHGGNSTQSVSPAHR